MFLKKILLVAGPPLVVLLAVVFLAGARHPAESSAAGSVSWFWVAVLTILGIILLAWKAPKLGSGTLAGTFWVIAALMFLKFALWKYVPQAAPMFKGMGLLHIPIYIIAIIIFAGLESTTKGRQYAFGVVALGVALAIIGLNHVNLSRLPAWVGGTVLNGSICTEKVQLTTLRDDGEEINPKGGCFARVHEEVAGQCLDVYDRWSRYLGNDCSGNLNLDGKSGARFAPSTSGSAKAVSVTYVLCNKRGKTDLVADECP